MKGQMSTIAGWIIALIFLMLLLFAAAKFGRILIDKVGNIF